LTFAIEPFTHCAPEAILRHGDNLGPLGSFSFSSPILLA
jgi:hypothetical protein